MNVKTPTGEVITLEVSDQANIKDVMAKIQEKVGIPREHQCLDFEAQELRNNRTLLDYHIPDIWSCSAQLHSNICEDTYWQKNHP